MHPTVFGKYEVVDLIGEGGFGRVFKGLDPDLKRPVAIKTCSLSEAEMRERFFREAEIAAKLHHPNITTVYDFGTQGGEPYLVQEYLTGEDLDHIIQKPDQVSLSKKVNILVQIGEGLAHAHDKGVIHRDVKPANIRILEDGQVRIMDFGIARLVEETQRLTQVGMTIGTAGYLSPEQLQGLEVDHRSDIFSFGVLAYELILRRRPFEGESISALFFSIAHQEPSPVSEVWPECPRALALCLSRCLEKDREVRYQNFREVTAGLRAAQTALPNEADLDRGIAGAEAEMGLGPITADSATDVFVGEPAAQPRSDSLPPVRGEPSSGPGVPPSQPDPGVPVPESSSPRRRRWILPLGGVFGVALVVALFEVARFPGRGESSPAEEINTPSFPVDEEPAGIAESAEPASRGDETGILIPQDPAVEAGEAGAAMVAEPPGGEKSAGSETQPPETVAEPSPGSAATDAGKPSPGAAATDAGETEAPFRGSATLVLFWSGGGDPGGVTTAENAFLEEMTRRGIRVMEAGLLAGLHDDVAALAMAQGMDARSIAGLGRSYNAEVLVVGSLRTEAAPSAGRFYTGRAVLDVRTYRASTAELLGSVTYQVGTGNTPGELGPSPLAAETQAAMEVGRRAAAGIAREFGDALPKRQ